MTLINNMKTYKCKSLTGKGKYIIKVVDQSVIKHDFPGGAVVKNPPANAGDTGSSPDPGRSHMPWSN